ncbi:hypothetical protein B5K08_22230 [Rhizobium leguminosarum bv. trifolii]|uniref:Uncharacterized protein n=1 Tax=Rhizobium leguminosarum bv. trifolii TaxID=386 RepID=A0A3E1B808_RHILT|nr:hypothetical protein B5K08_22230 [Rhizobium leguminosarum bv. trifolii]RFB87352.1 hypothetical protein B5K10_22220 [Rhizobium leguminosarum bv. trifolii]
MMPCYKRLPEPAINGIFRGSIQATISPIALSEDATRLAMALKLLLGYTPATICACILINV